MKHGRRLEALEAASTAGAGNGWQAWQLVALPGNTPNTFTMRKRDGTTHDVTAATLAAISEGAAGAGLRVVYLDR